MFQSPGSGDGESDVKLTLSEEDPKTFNLPLAVSLVPVAKRTNTPGSIVKLSPDGIVISQSTWYTLPEAQVPLTLPQTFCMKPGSKVTSDKVALEDKV